MRTVLTYGRNPGPKWLHWITWAGNWSFWLAWLQGARFSHFAIIGEGDRTGWLLESNINPGELNGGAPLPKKWLFHSGVAWRRWNPDDYKRYLIIDFPQIPYAEAMRVVAEESIVGSDYDWRALFWQGLPEWLRPRNRWKDVEYFCTELGAYVAKRVSEKTGAEPIVHPEVDSSCVKVDDYQKSVAGVWKQSDIVENP